MSKWIKPVLIGVTSSIIPVVLAFVINSLIIQPLKDLNKIKLQIEEYEKENIKERLKVLETIAGTGELDDNIELRVEKLETWQDEEFDKVYRITIVNNEESLEDINKKLELIMFAIGGLDAIDVKLRNLENQVDTNQHEILDLLKGKQ